MRKRARTQSCSASTDCPRVGPSHGARRPDRRENAAAHDAQVGGASSRWRGGIPEFCSIFRSVQERPQRRPRPPLPDAPACAAEPRGAQAMPQAPPQGVGRLPTLSASAREHEPRARVVGDTIVEWWRSARDRVARERRGSATKTDEQTAALEGLEPPQGSSRPIPRAACRRQSPPQSLSLPPRPMPASPLRRPFVTDRLLSPDLAARACSP